MRYLYFQFPLLGKEAMFSVHSGVTPEMNLAICLLLLCSQPLWYYINIICCYVQSNAFFYFDEVEMSVLSPLWLQSLLLLFSCLSTKPLGNRMKKNEISRPKQKNMNISQNALLEGYTLEGITSFWEKKFDSR